MDKTKHRNAFFALGGLFVVLVLIFSLVQCTQSYSVTFDTDGGNEIPAVSVNKDDTVARPQNPTKNGFTFAYWELDGEEFDFSQPITADIKLKAIWEAITYTVTFDSDGGSDVEAQVIAFGENANKPEDPIREGYSFIGWYLNEVEHDFSQVVEQDMHLLAMWEQVDDDVTDPDDDSEPVITTQTERRTAVINFKTIEENDSTLDAGKTSIKQTGVNGQRTITYTVTYTDGRETSRVEVSRTTTRQPVDQIVLIGTKKVDGKPVITTKTETKTETIAFKTIQENDNTLEVGKTAVKQEGQNGVLTITYTVTLTDGVETSRVETSRTTTRQPVNKIVLVGTKESVYTFGTHRPANFLGSPQVVVTVYKDGTAVSANTVYKNTTVLGDKNNDQGLLLIDESLIGDVNRAQLANGTFVNVSKGGQ